LQEQVVLKKQESIEFLFSRALAKGPDLSTGRSNVFAIHNGFIPQKRSKRKTTSSKEAI